MDAISTHREYEILQKQIDEAQSVEDEKRKELQKEEKALSELNDLLKEQENSISSIEKDVVKIIKYTKEQYLIMKLN